MIVDAEADRVVTAPAVGIASSTAGFFIVAQMAGAGFVSLPAALANTGWIGVPMMVLFCVAVGFAAIILGYCWNILEERFPEEYSLPARQPYMEIAYRSFGKCGRSITFVCVFVSQFGGSTVFIVLIAQMLNILAPYFSTCEYVLIVGTLITPCTWLGTQKKEFWVGTMLAVASTILACVVTVIQVILDASDVDSVYYRNPTPASFALGFGTLLFSFSGTSSFPNIQNDMKDKNEFWKSVTLGFSVIMLLYIPVAVSGYAIFGYGVDDNIMLQSKQTATIMVAMVLQILNLFGSFVIGFNTVSQAVEDALDIPKNFNWKRVVARTGIVWLEVIFCLAIPDFTLIMNLIGSSTMTACSFILPPLMYLRLCKSGPKETQREVALWIQMFLIQIVILGCVGGFVATVSAVTAIVNTPFSHSCFSNLQNDV